MRLGLLLILLALGGCVTSDPVVSEPAVAKNENYHLTGQALLEECSQQIQDQPDNYYTAGQCMGYVSAIADVLIILGMELTREDPDCVRFPADGTYGEYVRIVHEYLVDHPERLDEYRHNLVVDALSEAFPCD